MKPGLILGSLLIVALSAAVHAAPDPPSGSISVASGSQLYLGGVVTFDWAVSGLKRNQNPRIQLVCTQDGETVYGEAHNAEPVFGDPPFDGASFLLGAAGSVWLQEGGEADCEATLYFWDFHPVQTFEALDSVTFHAGAGP